MQKEAREAFRVHCKWTFLCAMIKLSHLGNKMKSIRGKIEK